MSNAVVIECRIRSAGGEMEFVAVAGAITEKKVMAGAMLTITPGGL